MMFWIYVVLLTQPFHYASTTLLENDDTNHKLAVVIGQFERLHQELQTVKQKLDTTFEENHLLKERIDTQSKDIKGVLETNAHLEERLDRVFEENRHMKNILITLLEETDTDVHVPNNNEQNENEMEASSSVSEPVVFSDHTKGRQAKTQNGKLLPSEFQKEKRLFLQDNTITQLPAIIAFSVQLTGGHIQLGQHQTLGYNKVITNIGNAYDSRQNHFIAPIKGLYLLSLTGMNKDSPDLYLEMVKNGNQIAIVYCSFTTSHMGSQMIVEVLEKGDVVLVRPPNFAGTVHLNGGGPYNTFTGVLLFAV